MKTHLSKWQLPELAKLSPDNIQNLKQLARLGDGHVNDVSYSPDGRYLAIGSSIGVWLDNLENQQRHYIARDQPIDFVTFSVDSRLLAVISRHQVFIWQLETLDLWMTYAINEDQRHFAAISFHPHDAIVVVGGWDKQLHFLNLIDKQLIRTISYTEDVVSIAIHPDGKWMAVGGWNGTARLYDLQTDAETELPHLGDRFSSVQVTFSQSGILAYGSEGNVVLWNVEQSREQQRFSFGAQSFQDMTFSNDGTKLATAHWAGATHGPGHVRIFDLSTASEKIVASDSGVSVAFHPHDEVLAFADGGWKSTVYFFHLKTEEYFYKPSYGSIGKGLLITFDSRRIIYAASRGVIRVVEVTTGEEIAAFQKENYDPRSATGLMGFYPDENTVIYDYLDYGMKYYAWKVGTDKAAQVDPDWQFFVTQLFPFISLAAGDTELIAGSGWQIPLVEDKLVISSVRRVRTFKTALTTAGEVLVVERHFDTPFDFASLSNDDFASVENRETDSRRQGWEAASVSSSADGRWIAVGGSIGSGSEGQAVGFVWDVVENRRVFSFKSAKYYGARTGFALLSPNSDLAIFADTSGDIFIWDVHQAQLVHQYQVPLSLWDMCISPDGKLLIGLGSDGTIRFWGVPAES